MQCRPFTPCAGAGCVPRRPLLARPARLVARGAAADAPSAAQARSSTKHVLPGGVKLELLMQQATAPSQPPRPPLLFVHGSYHAAWCWQENFMPYFASRGYDTYAVSLRAQGGSDPAPPGQAVAGTLDVHAADLASLVAALGGGAAGGGGGGAAGGGGGGRAPVVVGHSFGGLILQKYILGSAASASASAAPSAASASAGSFPPLSGAAFLCSVPPSGNKQMVTRFLFRDPVASLKLTWGFIARSFATSLQACRELFFSPDIPADKLQRYQQLLAAASPTRLLDLKDMNAQVPLPPPPAHVPPAFVLGGANDTVVDVEALRELASYYGTKAVVLDSMAHDCMLDTRWELAARELESWLESL